MRYRRRAIPVAALFATGLATTLATGLAAGLTVGLAGPAVAGPAVTGVRIGHGPAKTRFVLDISAPVGFKTFTLGNPYRVVIDLPQVDWKLDPLKIPKGGLIKAFRFGHFHDDVSRVVLDVGRAVEVAKSFILGPSGGQGHRLVVDLRAIDAADFAGRQRRDAASGKRRPVRSVPSVPRPRPRDRERPIIAIDPGHGGVDPGTIGVSGTREKNITLGHALTLAARLRATGRYRTVLTRSRDKFVRLRKRVAIARSADADLFISLHADANPNSRVRGASVYTLSERASDKEAAALAAKENKADVIAGINLEEQSAEVANILIDLAQRETLNGSALFAKALTTSLGKVRLLLRNTHRFAGFAVLKSPDVPSILIELGHLSNRSDEKRLLSQAERNRIADSIIRAIDAYFARQQAFKR